MNDAFDLMLGVYRAPLRAALLRGRALPRQIIEVIRVAAGDTEAVADARRSTGLNDGELAEAAVLLLHYLLFFDDADHYRVLGVAADADDEQIKRHYRALMRWLHPDRNPDNLHSVFAERVNRAWNTLRTPQRRADYDRDRQADEDTARHAAAARAAAAALSVPHWKAEGRPWLSGRMVRRLPQIVAASGATVAVVLLALVVWLQRPQAQRPMAAIVPPALPLLAGPPAAPSAPTMPAAGSPVSANPLPAPPAPATLFASAASALTDAVAAPAAAAQAPAPAAVPKPDAMIARPTPAHGTAAARSAAARVASAVRPDTPRRPSAAPVAPPPAALSEAEVLAFVARFERLYAGDDVDAFLALFGDDAVGNGSDGLRELSIDYRRLFATYSRRELRLRDMRWQIDEGRAVGHGRYDAHVDASKDSPKDSQGRILLALRRDADGLRITRLNHSLGR